MARRRSNTVGNKLKEQQSLQQKTTYSSIIQQPVLLKLYVRRSAKPTRFIQIPCILNGSKLFEFIQRQFYIAADKQILFLRGQRIQLSSETQKRIFNFVEADIIHVHNIQNINRANINIVLHFLNADLIKIGEAIVQANCKQNLKNSIQDVFIYRIQDVDNFLFSQSGRFLNLGRSFLEEAVESQSIILVVMKNYNISALAKLQYRQMQIIQSHKKFVKRSSFNMVQSTEIPNFKKKCTCTVYKSMLIPESKQIIWQEQSNSSFSKRGLIKNILKRNIKHAQDKCHIYKQNISLSKKNFCGSIQKDVSNEQKFQYLKIQEFSDNKRKILMQSQRIGYNHKNLKQPPKMFYELFQQIQQIEFGEKDNQFETKQNQNNLQSYKNLISHKKNLTSSVGNQKGSFIPILPKDLRVLEDDDNDSDQ